MPKEKPHTEVVPVQWFGSEHRDIRSEQNEHNCAIYARFSFTNVQNHFIDPSRVHILILDPARSFAEALRGELVQGGFRVTVARTQSSALDAARVDPPNLVIKPALEDAAKPDSGVMEKLRTICPDTLFLFVSGHADVRMALRSMRRGAFDCIPLPCEGGQLLETINRALEHQCVTAENPEILARLKPRRDPDILTGGSPAMREVQEIVDRVADTDVTVLIEGESGTGKELAARLLHDRSRRANGPFVAVNCAALTDSIIESELFGHVKGAFTGAIADKPGRFALASGGTLFLDEIGDLSPKGQADLLRVLEDGIYRPIGSRHTIRADARIIAATNSGLEQACREGCFREDLLYRLNVVAFTLPPLRQRPGDIARLSAFFLRHFCARHKRPLKRLSAETLRLLEGFDWPGNVRQLRNAVERMVLLAPERVLEARHLPPHLLPSPQHGKGTPCFEEMTLADARDALIQMAIERCGGNKSEAARRLGISRRSMHEHLARMSDAGKPE